MENMWPIAYKAKITALVQYWWQICDKIQVFCKSLQKNLQQGKPLPRSIKVALGIGTASGPFWVGRKDARCLECITLDLMGTVGAPGLILYQDSGALTAPSSGQELRQGKPTRFARVQSKVLIN